MPVGANVLWSLGGLYVILIVASFWIVILCWRSPEHDRSELTQRIRSWWIIVTIFSAALVMRRGLHRPFSPW